MTWSFDGTDVRVEIAPDDALWAESPTWVDISDDVRELTATTCGRSRNIEATQPGTLTVTVDNTSRDYDALHGPARVTFDGTTTNVWGCGDIAAFSGATQLDVRAVLSLDDWTPGTATTIIGQWGAAGNRSWLLRVTTGGALQLSTSSDGTATSSRDSSVRACAVDGQVMCVRVTWTTAGSGTTTYYVKRAALARAIRECRSDDDWVQLGAADTGVTAALFNSTADVRIAGNGSTGATEPLDGSVYYAQAATTINGTPAVTFWPRDAASSAATSWVSAETGETWSKTGTASTITTEGTYYGRLLPGTPIRVVATRSATDYPLWSGYVRSVPQTWPSMGLQSLATISAVDGLGWLQDIIMPDTPAQFDAYAIDSTHFYGMHEPSTVLAAEDANGAADAQWSGPREPGGVTQPGAPTLPTSLLVSGQPMRTNTPAAFSFSTAGVSIVASIYLPNDSASFRIFSSDGTNTVGISHGGGTPAAWMVQAIGARYLLTDRIAPGWHTLRVEVLGTAANVYVDDARMTLGGTTSAVSVPGAIYVDGNSATVSDVFVGPLGSATYDFRGLGGAGHSTKSRLVFLLYATGIIGLTPVILELGDADDYTLCGPTATGTSLGELCRQVETAELGRWVWQPAGYFELKGRAWTLTATAATVSQGTFGDQAGEIAYSDLTVTPLDRADVINDCTVSTPDGASANVTDADSITEFGRRTFSASAACSSVDTARALAAEIIRRRSWPRVRVSGLELRPHGDANRWAQVLQRGIGERVTVMRRPSGGTAATFACTVERMQHTIRASGEWVTRWELDEAIQTSAEAGLFTLDDAVLGIMDAGNVLAY